MIRRDADRNIRRANLTSVYSGNSRQLSSSDKPEELVQRQASSSANGKLELMQIKGAAGQPQDVRSASGKIVQIGANSAGGYYGKQKVRESEKLTKRLNEIKSSLQPFENGPAGENGHDHDVGSRGSIVLRQLVSLGIDEDVSSAIVQRYDPPNLEAAIQLLNMGEPPNGMIRATSTSGFSSGVIRKQSFDRHQDLAQGSPGLDTSNSSRSGSPSVTISFNPRPPSFDPNRLSAASSTSERSVPWVSTPSNDAIRSWVAATQGSAVSSSISHLNNTNGQLTPPPGVGNLLRETPSPQLDLRGQVPMSQMTRRVSPVPSHGIYTYAGSPSQCSTPQRGVSPVANRTVWNFQKSGGDSPGISVSIARKGNVSNKFVQPPPPYTSSAESGLLQPRQQTKTITINANSTSAASQPLRKFDSSSIIQRINVLSSDSNKAPAVTLTVTATSNRQTVVPSTVGPTPAMAWTARHTKTQIMQSKSTHVPKPMLQTAVTPLSPSSQPAADPIGYVNSRKTDPPSYSEHISNVPSYSQPSSRQNFITYSQARSSVPTTSPPTYEDHSAIQALKLEKEKPPPPSYDESVQNKLNPGLSDLPNYTTQYHAQIIAPLEQEIRNLSIQELAYSSGNCPPSICSTRSSNSDYVNPVSVAIDLVADSPPSFSASHSPLSTTSTPSTNSDYVELKNPPPSYSQTITRLSSPVPERRKLKKSDEDGEDERRESVIVKNYSPQAYKFYMEQHVENIMKSHQQRVERRRQLEKEMRKVGLSEEAQCQMRKMLQQKESNYMRLKRAKMKKSMFKKLKTLGIGAFGEVALVKKIDTGQLYAMKTLRKSDVLRRNQVAHVKAERDILAEADNEWVVKLYYSFQNKDNLYFVMEYIPGGDMMSLLIKLQIFQEPLARFYIAELVCAIESVHKMGFIHRDIKPDNILIDRDGHIKLTDFGLCTGFRWTHNSKYYQKAAGGIGNHSRQDSMEPDHAWDLESDCKCVTGPKHDKPLERRRKREHQRCLAHSLVGTPNYIAPEVLLRQGYTQLCDWWSVGVILYEMIVGQPPFHAATPAETQMKVINWKKYLRVPKEANISEEANHLIFKLLTCPEERLGKNGAEEIKHHSFFANIDWSSNIRKQPAPYCPKIQHATDTSNFDPVAPDKLRNDESNSGDESYDKKGLTWTLENGKYPEHAFIEFTFRRFFDDGGYPLSPARTMLMHHYPQLDEESEESKEEEEELGRETREGGEDADGQNPVYV